jgi:hypothetical protein
MATSDSSAKYSALEHGGLEAVETNNAPEVVPGTHAPLERRSSLNQPEPVHPEHQQQDQVQNGSKAAHTSYYGGEQESPAPAYEARPAYLNNNEKGAAAGVGAMDHKSTPQERRYCGIRRRWFIALIVGLIVLIIAAVVGAVCGVLLTRHKSK